MRSHVVLVTIGINPGRGKFLSALRIHPETTRSSIGELRGCTYCPRSPSLKLGVWAGGSALRHDGSCRPATLTMFQPSPHGRNRQARVDR